MRLYIVRHAWAGQHGDPRWPDDSLRPLTEKGTKRFRGVAKRLVKRGFEPTQIATSPLVRCRQTADILIDRLRGKATLSVLEQLSPGAELDALLPWTRQQAPADVAWVGHAPDVDHLIAALIGSTEAHISLAKGAVAAIDFEESPAAGAGMLAWLATAEVLGA
jgi:phosphohistidine phosphatase